MIWVASRDQLYNFIALVVLYAPDRFPKEDFLADDEQLTLDRAFAVLNDGISFVREKISDSATLERVQRTLDDSFGAYRSGDAAKGVLLLQEFRRSAFPERKW